MNSFSLDESGNVHNVEIVDVTKEGTREYFDNSDSRGFDDGLLLAKPLKAFNPLSSPATKSSTSKNSLQGFLQVVPHLFTLSAEQIASLDIMVREYGEMSVIIEEGQLLQHIYVLASGTVEVMNSKKGLKRAFGHRRIGTITAPNLFGIDDAILESPVEFTYHSSSKTTLLLIHKEKLIRLFPVSPLFANNVSSRLLQTLPAFAVFQDFCRSLFGLSSSSFGKTNMSERDKGYRLSLSSLVQTYKQSGTVFHKLVNSDAIDTEALKYCVRRLPSNIAQTYILILTTALPGYISNEFLADAAANVHTGSERSTMTVDTGKRRRCAWKFGDGGQTLVMVRDGFTDIIDFVSNLCMLTVEARKICTRLKQLVAPSAIEIIRKGLQKKPSSEEIMNIFDKLPFKYHEVESMKVAWGDNALHEIYNILLHREEYIVRMEPSKLRRFCQDAYGSWTVTLVRHIKAAMGVPDEAELPSDIVIDILFSPNRTVKNLMCSMSSDLKELIYDLPLNQSTAAWKNEENRYYYVLTGLLEKEATIREAYRARLESNGFTLLEDVYSSALIVDLIDISKIKVSDMDSAVQPFATAAKQKSLNGKRHFIINIDKDFGAQIEAILRPLLLTFANRIKSINLTGKAAGLVGNRGDVVLPSKLLFSKRSFGEDSTDEIRLCNTNSLTVEDTTPFLGESSVHRGTCITFPGFVLQSHPVLKFYKVVHGCSALEMRSSYVARQLEECRRAGVLSTSITSRYLFYFDDMPLGNANESHLQPKKKEIISTIYGSARSLLSQILS